MAVLALNESSFDHAINDSTLPVLVDFYADWCGPCKRLAPVLEELAAENDGQVLVCKVDVDTNKELAARFGVMSIPLVVCFKNGQPVGQLLGGGSKEKLLELTR